MPVQRALPSGSTAKIVDLQSGEFWSTDRWRDVKTVGSPLQVLLTIDAAGIIEKWEYLSEVPDEFNGDLALTSVLIRSMDAGKTGETHARIWQSELGKKDGRWVAKIYEIGPTNSEHRKK